jgi:50S ribosomal protein L16 3-hydroxylase
MRLSTFDTGQFLREAWQHKPLLIRNAWDAWRNPLAPDELAGLACEPGIEARLITQESDGWALEHGPLPEQRFAEIGKRPWTLLVQAVDHHVPAVAQLLEAFRFIPNWRVDDVMVSYAVDGGGVGAHFDHYDVFLVQGLGRRRWQVGARCDAAAPMLPHDDLRLLADFAPTEEWVLEPGDMLYVPPGFPHNGIAVGDDCMTYSVGFRAPSRGELLADWTESLVGELADDDRYVDRGLAAQESPGEISPSAIAALHRMVTESLADREAFARWFGTYTTAPKREDIDWRPDTPIRLDEVRSHMEEGVALMRNPASRFSFVRGQAGAVILFVDGRSYDCSGVLAAFAERLCAHPQVATDSDFAVSAAVLDLIVELANQGSVAFEPSAT